MSLQGGVEGGGEGGAILGGLINFLGSKKGRGRREDGFRGEVRGGGKKF